MYFANNDADNGIELWKYNGVNVPSMAADICLGSCSSNPDDLVVFNNELILKQMTALTEMNCGSMMELMLQVWLLILDLEVAVPILTNSKCLTMHFILKHMMELTDMNYGSMME